MIIRQFKYKNSLKTTISANGSNIYFFFESCFLNFTKVFCSKVLINNLLEELEKNDTNETGSL